MESLPGLQQSGEGKAVASGVASKSVVLPLDVDSNKSRGVLRDQDRFQRRLRASG